MKNLNLVGNFDLGGESAAEKDKDVKVWFDGARRKIIEIKLRSGALLTKHSAVEPITVFCLSGNGTFRAGADLSESQKLSAGTLITLEAGIEHEVVAEPELHVLVTKFKSE